ncbi:uncharacterized protein LOC144342894 [Saccoglossus kowalevskii]
MIGRLKSIYIAILLVFAACIIFYCEVLKVNIKETKKGNLENKASIKRTLTKSIYDPRKESKSRIKTVKEACKQNNIIFEAQAKSRFVISEKYKFMVNVIPKHLRESVTHWKKVVSPPRKHTMATRREKTKQPVPMETSAIYDVGATPVST